MVKKKSRLCLLGAVVVCFFSHYTFAALVTGPDAYGYVAETTGYNLRDIQSTGTILPPGDDEGFVVPIGFDFTFNNSTMNNIVVNINGFLESPSSLDFYIMGYLDDLRTGGYSSGDAIYYQTVGDAGSREFIAGYYGVSHFPLSAPSSDRLEMTFEMILHEGTNNIEFQYAELFDQNVWDRYYDTTFFGSDARDGLIGLRYFPYNQGDNLSINDAVGYHEYTGYLISQVPIPAAVWLFGSGLIGLIGVARRKKA